MLHFRKHKTLVKKAEKSSFSSFKNRKEIKVIQLRENIPFFSCFQKKQIFLDSKAVIYNSFPTPQNHRSREISTS